MWGAFQGLADSLLEIRTMVVAEAAKTAGDGAPLARAYVMFSAGEFLLAVISALVE